MGHMNECIRVHQRLYDGELGLFNSRREGWRSKGEQAEPLQIASAIPTLFLSRSVATLPRAPASSQEPWSAFQILQFQLETTIIARTNYCEEKVDTSNNGRDNSEPGMLFAHLDE